MAPERIASRPPAEGDLFAELRHQPQAVEHLRHALATDHVAHAYAFVGPHGSGRKAAALALATALVTRNAGTAARTPSPLRARYRAASGARADDGKATAA